MILLHKVQLFLERVGFSRWMVDPHDGAEFWTAFFTWSILLAFLAAVYMLCKYLRTPRWIRMDPAHIYSPAHKYGMLYRMCRWYLVYAFLMLAAWVMVPWVSPALAASLTMK